MSILEAFIAGKEARRQADAAAQVNALQQYLAQNGQAIFAGDQRAIGGLAGFGMDGMNMAIGVRDSMDQRARAQKQDARADQEWQFKLEEYKKSKSQEELAAEAAELEKAVKMALAVQTPEQFDQLMTQYGHPELVGQFDNRQALAAQFMSMADVMKMNEPMSAQDRYKVVGGSLFDLSAEGGPAPVGQGAMQEEIVMGPDGKPIIVRGGPGTATKFTEAQSKDNVYATRAEGALTKLESQADPNNPEGGTVADQLGSLPDNLSSRIPVVGNYMTGEGYQVAETAGQEFLQAILRKDTGAAITAQEQSLYGETYLPQPGDSQARLSYKAEARRRAVEAIKAGMSEAQIEAMARADAAVVAKMPKDGGAAPVAPVTSQPARGGLSEGALKWLEE